MTKNKLNKLALRRETLTALEMQAAGGGAAVSAAGTTGVVIVAQTVHSICTPCIYIPVIPRYEWPQQIGG